MTSLIKNGQVEWWELGPFICLTKKSSGKNTGEFEKKIRNKLI
jgi:hypothetical protein